MRLAAAFAIACALTAPISAQQTAGSTPPDPTGDWLVANKYARIRIADCGGQMWGVVQWEAQPGVDRKNPNPNLRNRPTLGMPILLGMTRSKPNAWEGQIYNSQDGHTYSASITLQDPSTLRVEGCFLGFLCGGENWTRVDPQDLPDNARAGAPQSAPAPPPRTGPPPGNRKPGAPRQQQAEADDVCLRLFGPSRLPH